MSIKIGMGKKRVEILWLDLVMGREKEAKRIPESVSLYLCMGIHLWDVDIFIAFWDTSCFLCTQIFCQCIPETNFEDSWRFHRCWEKTYLVCGTLNCAQ